MILRTGFFVTLVSIQIVGALVKLPRLNISQVNGLSGETGFPNTNCIDDDHTTVNPINENACVTPYVERPWFEIDMGEVYAIELGVIYTRLDCCENNGLRNYEVRVRQDPSEAYGSLCATGELASGPGPFTIVCNTTGRFVRFGRTGPIPGDARSNPPLQLAEIYIYGPSASPVSSAVIELTGRSPVLKFGPLQNPVCEFKLDPVNNNFHSTCDIATPSGSGRRLEGGVTPAVSQVEHEALKVKYEALEAKHTMLQEEVAELRHEVVKGLAKKK